MKQSLRRRHEEQGKGVGGTSGFAEHGDALRITAEGARIALHPAQGLHHIEIAEIARGLLGIARVRWDEPTEGAEAIVDHHDEDTLASRERRAVVECGMPDRVTAAVNPYHHR